MTYVEPGGSWRPLWLVAGVLGLLVVLDVVLPGPDVPPLLWVLAVVAVPGIVAFGCSAARRVWTVRVAGAGPDRALSVGRERVPLADVDAAHLRAVREGTAGVDAGAPVLGGGWSLPRGRTGLPLRLTDGRTVLVPTRDPAALSAALLDHAPGSTASSSTAPESGVSHGAGPDTPDGRPGNRRTLGP
ncbi:hypothetical protein SAMN05660657_00976 [Geodermatophilus amargosae]|uniref:Uncharacterized protein n=1 Tax=Geodermatophilus amargosae TaxID=1296565 RepID=A0A1I6Y7I2_9ACTN|nr:hypothetical protein [Geodermatophilus amargosae]SFT46446.1 hypothetical protein SAMN05660657_00976 [Geodermatophilus amargosae]